MTTARDFSRCLLMPDGDSHDYASIARLGNSTSSILSTFSVISTTYYNCLSGVPGWLIVVQPRSPGLHDLHHLHFSDFSAFLTFLIHLPPPARKQNVLELFGPRNWLCFWLILGPILGPFCAPFWAISGGPSGRPTEPHFL